MAARWPRFVFTCTLLILFCASLRAQEAPTQDGPAPGGGPDVAHAHTIGDDDILRMKNAGLSDAVLLQTIQLQPGKYATGPDDLIRLKQAGLSDRVIAAMQAHGTGLQPRILGDRTEFNDRNDRPTLTRVYPPGSPLNPAPLAPGIDEIGVYYKDKDGQWQMLRTERVEFRSSNRLKTALTDGILREDTNGWLAEPKSPLVLQTGTELLVYAPRGTGAEEYDFLRLNQHKDSRDFRVRTGGVLHSQTGAGHNELQFDPKRIAPQMYTFTVPKDIEKGEYGMLPPASSNGAGMTHAGKIFTFSIRE